MMQLALVLLMFFASVTTASGECAWVLWEDTIRSSVTSTEPVRAYSTKPECDVGLSVALASFTAASGVTVQKTNQQEVFVTAGKQTTVYRYVCLPDTIDPRGSKAR